jgi:hypothetical protein
MERERRTSDLSVSCPGPGTELPARHKTLALPHPSQIAFHCSVLPIPISLFSLAHDLSSNSSPNFIPTAFNFIRRRCAASSPTEVVTLPLDRIDTATRGSLTVSHGRNEHTTLPFASVVSTQRQFFIQTLS